MQEIYNNLFFNQVMFFIAFLLGTIFTVLYFSLLFIESQNVIVYSLTQSKYKHNSYQLD